MKDFKPVLMTALGIMLGMILFGLVKSRVPGLSSFESDYELSDYELD